MTPEDRWIYNRKEIWSILLAIKRGKINCIQGEKQIRKILYGNLGTHSH